MIANHKQLRIVGCFFGVLPALMAVAVLGEPIYVDVTRPAGGSGTGGWVNAFRDLQDAINLAHSNPAQYPEIRVADGRYTPDSGTHDRSQAFHLVNGVQIKGGYAGFGAPNPDERNILRYETILSGDLNGDDIPCDIHSSNGDNSFVVVFAADPTGSEILDRSAVLEGFTITGGSRGFNDGVTITNSGGGICVPSLNSPTIRSCKVKYNLALYTAGAIYVGANCLPLVESCTIEGNEAKFGGSLYMASAAEPLVRNCIFIRNKFADFGGAMYLSDRAKPTIQQCIFEANQAGGGGALYIGSSSQLTIPIITDCKFKSNECFTNGGGGGGAIYNKNLYPFVVLNCLFSGNKSHNGGTTTGGGAVRNTGAVTCQYVNCAFSRNSADGFGGAIYSDSTFDPATLTLVNCSFSNNSATANGGGVRATAMVSLVVRNSLFWGNTSSDSVLLDKQISTAGPTPTASYNSIQGCSGCYPSGAGNNPTDPSFVNAATDNLRLRSGSLVIDSAENCQLSGSFSTDLDGRARRTDYSTSNTGHDCVATDPCSPTCTPGTITYLDRGAYEYPLNNGQEIDCNSNGRNDNEDIACGGGNICGGKAGSYDCNHDGIPDECLPPCLKGDVNHDGVADGRDIQAMVNRLLGAPTCTFGDCESDVNGDSFVNVNDVPCFASVLVGLTSCAYTCSATLELVGSPDCNGNGVNDANDIVSGYSHDCNNNFIPDECDLASATSNDVNGNSIPDECEPDCDKNGVPDAWDISHGAAADINANGVPDRCEPDCNHNGLPDNYDISQHSSADCNSNGTPDECEGDCNHNGVPDDCDLASGFSPDCDGDGFPDECELAYGPMIHVFDCNNNGVPDNCDIASGYSNDSNHNGIPDECESGGQIASPAGGGSSSPSRKPSASAGFDVGGEPGGNSVDTAQGGSNENTGETPMPPDTNTGESPGPQDTDAAWEAFYEWADTQCWGLDCETTGSEQFQAYLNKLAELGLPVEGP